MAMRHVHGLFGELENWSADAVAIVGVGLRLPGGVDCLDELWAALIECRNVAGTGGYLAQSAFLDDAVGFDAGFFGLSPAQAARLEPEQRLVLECAVEALDDAGIAHAGLADSDTAVVVAASGRDDADPRRRDLVGATANEVSRTLGLRGAARTVDTSALVAVHRACELVRSGRSGLALAGGVNLLLSQDFPPVYAAGAGSARAEGAGVFVLKPLGTALADGDRVHAVIAGSGATGSASPGAQAAFLARVYAEAGVEPHDVGYVEAHGTVDDLVGCEALGGVLGRNRDGAVLPMGSVTANLGHAESAAGVAGLLKAILVLRERRIPATPHLDAPPGETDLAGLGLEAVDAVRPLGGRGVVGVSGNGRGVDVHVVVGAPPPPPAPARPARDSRLPVVISARTPDALADAALRWTHYLDKTEPADFYDVAFTACVRRGHHERRLALVADGPQEAAATARLLAVDEQAAGGVSATAVHRGRICFVFDGNGSQWAGMGCDLLTTDDVFRTEVTAVDEVLTPMLGWSVLGELTDPDLTQWDRVDISQPLLFAVQAGIVASLAARGVVPAVVTGHSVGEVAAAYCAGALDLHTACWVVVERTRAQAATAGTGRMAVLGLGAAAADRLLAELGSEVVVAADNSRGDVTLCGPTEALAAFGEEAERRGLFFRDIGLDYPYHGPAMDAVRDMLTGGLAGMTAGTCRLPMVSALTGDRVTGPDLDGEYWWRNLRHRVRFTEAVDRVVGEHGCDVLVEIGPRPVLGTYLRRLTEELPEPVAVVPTMTRKKACAAALEVTQLHLMAAGAHQNWEMFFPERGKVANLPAYPWQREHQRVGAADWQHAKISVAGALR